MNVRVCGFSRESVVDGPGIRAVVYTQGCSMKCRGCHNPSTWDPEGGYDMDIEGIFQTIRETRLLRGVTFSGGEPFLQPEPLAELARKVKGLGLNVVTFSGYTYEELLEMGRDNPQITELLGLTDLLIDGPFKEEERDLGLAFRGSRNQRIIDVQQSLASGTTALADIN